MSQFSDFAQALDTLVSTRVWTADAIPADAQLPHIGIEFNSFPATPGLSGDARTLAWTRLAQIDVWQDIDTDDGTLTVAVCQALNGLRLSERRMRAQLVSVVRAPEDRPSNLVHDAITVRIAETL